MCETARVPLPHGRAPGALAAERLTGHWRYNRAAGRGIALSYHRSVRQPPPSMPPVPEPKLPSATHSPVVRVLCFCGELFTFDGDAGVCPSCGQPAAWPTMSAVEREMRADLEELLRVHDQGVDPD